jgi:hypothetical protein
VSGHRKGTQRKGHGVGKVGGEGDGTGREGKLEKLKRGRRGKATEGIERAEGNEEK